MVGMTAILVVAAIAVVGAVIARVTWRRPADERHSIQSHQQTLDTLRSMADRRPGSPGNGASAPPARPPAARPAPARSGAARAGTSRSGPVRASTSSGGAGHEELVFVDDAGASAPRPDGSPRISPLASTKGLHRAGGRDRLAWGRDRGIVGRVVPVMAAVVVLAVVVGVALALAPSHHASPRATSPSTKASGHVAHQTTSSVPAQVQPTTSTSSSAVYGAPSSNYTVSFVATGPCWVDATVASTGAVVWTGTLQTGQTQAVPATSSLNVRLGAANDVSVTLNGVPVVLPTGFQSPFDMRFQAA
jgi:hypothetical protein